MKLRIPANLLETVDIVRYSATTDLPSTLHSDVDMHIQADMGSMTARDNYPVGTRQFKGFVITPLSGLQVSDRVQRTGKDPDELYIIDIPEYGSNVQYFQLAENLPGSSGYPL